MNLEHLKTISEGAFYHYFSQPFSVEVNKQTWSVATDGKVLFAVAGDIGVSPLHEDLSGSNREKLVEYIKGALSAKDRFDLDSLRAFVGAYERDIVKDCRECDGAGSVCSCGECQCENCDEGEVTVSPKPRRGWINGRYCDLNYAALLLAGAAGDTCIAVTEDPKAPINFSGDGWVAVLMPLVVRPGDGSDKAPSWSAV